MLRRGYARAPATTERITDGRRYNNSSKAISSLSRSTSKNPYERDIQTAENRLIQRFCQLFIAITATGHILKRSPRSREDISRQHRP